MDAEAVEAWLKKKPRPKIVRLVTGSETRDIKLHPGQTWAPIVESLLDCNPDRIEALDQEGGLLRAVSAENETVASPPAPKGAPKMAVSPAALADPETQRFVVVSNLIAEAYRHSNDVAFARMVDLFEAVNERHTAAERTMEQLHKLLQKAAAHALENEDGDKPLDFSTLASAFLGGMNGATPTNGKADK